MNRVRLFRWGDWLFAAALLAAAYLLQVELFAGRNGNGDALVEVNGEVRYRLNLKVERHIILEGFRQPIEIEVKDAAVRIVRNYCPQSICMTMGAVSRPGQMIVCVPHKILIYIPKNARSQEAIEAVTG